jgi:hypothetical protein
MTDRPRAVNVHAHFLIPGDLQLARAAREGSYAGSTDGVWSPEIATTFMDTHHIQMQMQRLRRVSGGRAPRAFRGRQASTHPPRAAQFTHEIPLRPRIRGGKVDRSRYVVPVDEELNSRNEIVLVNP